METLKLRDYQTLAINNILKDLENYDKIVAELATGAGKSLIIASLVNILKDKTDGKIIILQPSKELVSQNYNQFMKYFKPSDHSGVSVFSASLNRKELSNQIIFASPLSIKSQVAKLKGNVSYVICDEAHLTTPTITRFIDNVTVDEPIKVVGLTATPYTLKNGLIYELDLAGDNMINSNYAKAPYYEKLSVQVNANTLVDKGFLTRPKVNDVEIEYVDDDKILKTNGEEFTNDSIERFVGDDLITEMIIDELLETTVNHKAVMIFATSIKHASLIKKLILGSELIIGDTNSAERDGIINRFKNGDIKYIVNVSVLTTGFDVPHVDCIAILRPTMSNGLYQQIIGRGLRLSPNKTHVDILDFAGNVERLRLQHGVLNVQNRWLGKFINLVCPSCKANKDNDLDGMQRASLSNEELEHVKYDTNGFSKELNMYLHNRTFCENRVTHGCDYTFREVESPNIINDIEYEERDYSGSLTLDTIKTNEDYIPITSTDFKVNGNTLTLIFNKKYEFELNEYTEYSRVCNYRDVFKHLKPVDNILRDFKLGNYPRFRPSKIKVNHENNIEVVEFL